MKNKKSKFKIIKGKGKISKKSTDDIEDEMYLRSMGSGLMSNILTVIEERFSLEQQERIMSEIDSLAEKDWDAIEVGKDFIGSIYDVIRQSSQSREEGDKIIMEILSRPNPGK